MLCGSLELANRSIISGKLLRGTSQRSSDAHRWPVYTGSVRLVYAILYSLFLGFGLSIGSEIYARTGLTIYGSTDYTCSALRGDGVPWYRNTIPPWWCKPCSDSPVTNQTPQRTNRCPVPQIS